MIEDTSKRDMAMHLLGALGGNEEYIGGMEAAGQRQVVAAIDLLPADGDWEALRVLGFGTPEPTDDELFVKTTLPEGWKKVGSDHSMWSYVADERGVNRVGIFYKAAFYDRRASVSVENVGFGLATKVIYGDDEARLPEKWDVLTSDERAEFVRHLNDYRQQASEFPDIYGDRLPRAAAALALAEEAE